MVSYADYKKNKENSFDKLKKNLEKSAGYDNADKRFWNITKDKSGVGSALIRFIPSKDEYTYFAKYYQHNFKSGAKYFNHTCPTTIGNQCPVCDANSELWATGTDEAKKIVSGRSRKTNYVSNIYVVSDSGNPENNGKVFLFRFGQKIYNKIKTLAEPEFADADAKDAWDIEGDVDFKLRVKSVADFPNYDDSQFDNSNALKKFKEEQFESMLDQTFSLAEFSAVEYFQSYDKLKEQFEKVVGWSTPSPTNNEPVQKAVMPKASASSQYASTKYAPQSADQDDDVDIASILNELDND
jgi:hypothetical protein